MRSGGRGAHPPARGGRGTGRGRISSLYQRLPHGPHSLDREEVLRHQRRRIHGAMIEAVARSGYHGASVKEIIGLAGVSRRSFYEQFANKHECFLATFDVVAASELWRMRRAYLETEGGTEQRLREAFRACAMAVLQQHRAFGLVLLQAPTAGDKASCACAGRAGPASGCWRKPSGGRPCRRPCCER